MAAVSLFAADGIEARCDDGVATVTLCDDAGHNALGHALVGDLGTVFAALARRDDVRAVILAGGEEWFSSGASREVIEDLVTGRRDSAELVLPRLLLECPVPVVAAMAGHALGGGFALGVAADIVVLARESRYCLGFLDLGFTPGMGTTALLEHVLSPAIAHELLFTGEARRGGDLCGRGINHVVAKREVLALAQSLAARIADKPRAAIVALKRVLSAPRRQAFELARTHEALMHALAFAQPGAARRILDALTPQPEATQP